MEYAVPSSAAIDKAFGAAAARPMPSQAAPKGGSTTTKAPAGSAWKPAVVMPAASGNAAMLVAQLRQASATYYSLPRTKAQLAQLATAVQRALGAVEGLLKDHFPLRNGQTHTSLFNAYLNDAQWKRLKPHDQTCFRLLEWQKTLKSELSFLRSLSQYASPRGKGLVRHALDHRYRMIGNVLMAGLHSGHVHEYLDPRHRATKSIQSAMQAWLAQQIEDGEDPADNIIDFLLAFDAGDYDSSARSMTADRLRSHELKFRDGKVWAYYIRRKKVGEEGEDRQRYYNYSHDWQDAILAVRRETYDSAGGSNTEAAFRGKDDFLQSDTYVVAGDGKFYSFGGDTIHSEFFSGAPVQAAGKIVAVAGEIQAIDNRSGHYLPNWKNLLQAVKLLADARVLASEAVIGLVCSNDSTMYFTVPDYIRLGNAGFPYTATFNVVSGYQRRSKYDIPVPPSKLRYIPGPGRKNWNNAAGNKWDLFFRDFYPSRSMS